MKKLKTICLALCLMCIGMLVVSAASKTIYTNNSYKLDKGGAVAVVNLSAPNNNAKATIEITSITSGTKKTRFVGSKLVSGKYQIKANATSSITLNTCSLVTIGNIGKGTWQIVNYADNGSGSDYAGWGGYLTYTSVS